MRIVEVPNPERLKDRRPQSGVHPVDINGGAPGPRRGPAASLRLAALLPFHPALGGRPLCAVSLAFPITGRRWGLDRPTFV